MTPPHLLHFRVSHYNEKVRWALDRKGIAHTREALVPGFHLPRVWTASRQTKLPVLRLDGATLWDSTRILAYIETRHPEPPLYPDDPEARARALAIEDHFDEVVAPDVRRMFWACYLDDAHACARMANDGAGAATRVAWLAAWPFMRPLFRRDMKLARAETQAARARLAGHFDRLESEIGPSGFLVGERFGVADLTAAAVMTAIIRPPEFPYPLPEPWPAALVELRESVARRAGFRWVLDMYARHRDPSAEIVRPAAR